MSYATTADVLARLGRTKVGVGVNSGPSEADVQRYADDVSASMDATFAAMGASLPVTDQASAALRPIVADAAALMTLGALYPSAAADSPADRLIAAIEARLTSALAAIDAGTSPIVKLLLIAVDQTSRASSFWTNEPQYDLFEPYERITLSESIVPMVNRAMRF